MQQNISQNFITNLNFNIDDDMLYILPQKGLINFKGTIQTEELSQNDNIQQPLKSIANELVEKTIPIRQSWVLLNKDYQFNFPPSYFKKKIVISRDNDQDELRKEVNIYDFIPHVKFNDEQLNQIRREATFEVQSKHNRNIKKKWIISRWLIKGTVNIKNSFYKDMLRAQDCVRGLGDFIYNKKNFNKLWNFSIVHGIYLIIKKSLLIPSLFIGYRETIGDASILTAQLQVERERQLSLRNKNLNFAIYQYFFHTEETKSDIKSKVDYLKLQLKNFEQDCSQITKLLKDLHAKQDFQHNNQEFKKLQEKYNIIYDKNKDIDELINDSLNNAQQRFLQQNILHMPQPVSKQLLDIIECYKLWQYYQDLLKNELIDYENQVILEYEKDYFFLNNLNHKEKYIKNMVKSKKKILKKQYQHQMTQELMQQNIVDANIYIEFYQNKKKYQKRVKQLVEIAQDKFEKPNIEFELVRLVVPPYPIIQERGQYYFIQEIKYRVTSQYYFWKLSSLCLLYITLVANSYYAFYQVGIFGHYGLFVIFSIEKFYNDQKINSQTGEITDDEEVETICSTLKSIYSGMQKSRREFEESEDDDMFGKGCLRICNLIEVYIFRFLFVGVFCTLILKPMLILLLSSMLFFIFITSFMWAAFIVLIKWIICLLFFDFETVEREVYNELDYIHCTMPLFRALLDIMIGIIEIMASLFCLLIFPFLAILIILFGILRYLTRYAYDSFMMILFYCCGRVPYRSGSLAWRVGGDNIQKKIIYNYHKLTNEELMLLTARELEKYILDEFQHRIQLAIQQPENVINHHLQPFFNRFNAQYQFADENSKLLLNKLTLKIAKQKARHPELDIETKQFTKYSINELQEVKVFLISFLTQQINQKNMHSFIWNRTGLQIGDYQGLVDIIINSIFGKDFIIKQEELEELIQIKVEKEKGFAEQIERAMNGEVNLNQPEKIIIEQKKEVPQPIRKKAFKKFIQLSEIIDKIWLAQQLNQQWTSLTNKHCRFLLNYSLRSN